MNPLKYKHFLAIDPGKSGGIVLQKNEGVVSAFIMPDAITRLDLFMKENITDPENTLCFIERVQMWTQDSDAENKGKQFAILKMLEGYERLKSVLTLNNIDFVQVSPQSWQKGLHLVSKGVKEEKKDRKNRYKLAAQAWYPHIKANLKNCDALLIHRFLRMKMQNDQQWIFERIPYYKENKIF